MSSLMAGTASGTLECFQDHFMDVLRSSGYSVALVLFMLES